MAAPTRDWSEFERRALHPPFTPADFSDNPGGPTENEPFRREAWERLTVGTVDQLAGKDHDDPAGGHRNHLHPWCWQCILQEFDYERDTFSPQRPVYDEATISEQDSLTDDAERLALARLRWWMVNHNGKLPIERPEDSGGYDDEYLTRSQLKDLPVADPLIESILPRHSYGILRGRDGSLKTFVALDWSLCLATGQPWMGRSSESVRSLYIAGEGAYGLEPRIDAWEAARGIAVDDKAFVVRKSALSLFKPSAAFDHLLDYIKSGEFGLVVVDTLRRVSGSADGNGSDMGTVVDNLDRIKRATKDGSVLVIAHTGKDDHDTRGFSGVEDDADFVWHAKRDEMNLDLHCTKFKEGPDDFHIYGRAIAEEKSLVIVEAGAEEMVGSESQVKLLTTLREVFPDGASSTKLLEASGIPKTTFHRVRAELQKAGHIVNTGTKNRPFYELVQSHEVPSEETTSDLQESHEVPPGPTESGGSPTGPAALRAGPWDHRGTETKVAVS